MICFSRRAAAGRAQLLVKRGHTGRVELQAVVPGIRPLSAPLGTRRPCVSTLSEFAKFRQNSSKIPLKFHENLAKLISAKN